MNEIQQIYQGVVYCSLIVFGAALLVVGASALYRSLIAKCLTMFHSVPKSSLVAMLVFTAVATIHAQKRVYVDSSVESSGDGTKERPYKEISDAFVDFTSTTSRIDIALAPGIYRPMNITKIPVDANGHPLSISIATYERENEEVENAQWIIDGNADGGAQRVCYAVRLPACEATTNFITGVTVRNATNGIGNFRVKNCIVSDCTDAALVDCRAENTIVNDSGIGLDGGSANACSFTGCTNIVLRNADAEFCYITNNNALAVSGGTVDTCLIEGNDYGVTGAIIYASSILSNRRGGILGSSVAYNTLIAYNMDGDGNLSNYDAESVWMTNCCTAPMPKYGANNFYSAMPVYPGTYRLPLGSPVYRNGCTDYLNIAKDLYGKNRCKDGVTDIGAKFYSTDEGEIPKAPKSWWREKTMEYVESILEETGWSISYHEWGSLADNVINVISLKASYMVQDKIPYSWYYPEYAVYYFEYNDIMNYKSGKKKQNGEDITWWEEYVLGTDPMVADDYFRLDIKLDSDGLPLLSWSPDLGEDRIYLILGKKNLADEWVFIPDGDLTPYRFFKVAVDLP